jgi:hypothetical protein
VVNLYTQDYFRLIRSRLNDGGLATYWLPVHDMTGADARAIIRGFCGAFPDCALWAGYGLNWMLTGSRDGRPMSDPERFDLPWQDEHLRRSLASIGLERPEQLGATFMADSAQLGIALADTRPLTDNFPKRYSQGIPVEADYRFYSDWMDVRRTSRLFRESAWIRNNWPEPYRISSLDYFVMQPLVNEPEAIVERGIGLQMLAEVLRFPDLETPVLWLLGTDQREVEIARAAGTEAAEVSYVLGAAALAARDIPLAADYFERSLAGGDGRALAPALFSACRLGQSLRARDLAARHGNRNIGNRLARCW